MIVARAEPVGRQRGWLPALRRLCAIGMVLAAATVQAATPVPVAPVIVTPEVERVAVWPGLRIVHPDDGRLEPGQAAELAAGDQAMAVDNPDRVFGRAMRPYWALFSLHNTGAVEQSRVLALETTTQFDIRLFRRDFAGSWRPIQSVAEAADGRLGRGSAYPNWSLRLAPQRTSEFLLRIEGPSIVRFPVFAVAPEAITAQTMLFHVTIGITLGCCLFICIYVASLRRYLDDASISLFVALLVAEMIGGMWLSGFLAEMLPGVAESTLSPIGLGAFAVMYGSGSLHARHYLKTWEWSPRGDRLLLGLGVLWLVLAPWFAIVFPVASRVLLIWGGAMVALALTMVSIHAMRRKVPVSEFIAAAWLTYLLVSAYALVARTFGDPRVWASSSIVVVQGAVIAILFGVAMNQRLMRNRDLLVAAHQDALTQRETVAKLMRERSLLFAATNHDLRQPLMGVGLFGDLLRSAQSTAEREDSWRKLKLALREVDDLLIGIQQLAAVHEAAYAPLFAPFLLDDLLAPVIEEYRGRAGFKRIAIRYVPSQQKILTHAPYFQRIVRNLLSNAIRYTDHGGRILVGCRRGGGLRLLIADNGRGMSEQHVRLAFDAFQRFDSQVSITDGFGLGLFSVKSLAKPLGLDVSLSSEVGRGTVFQFSIPRP